MPNDLPAPGGPPVEVDCGVGGRVVVPLSISSFIAAGGADQVAIDTTRSTIAIPDTHSVNVIKRDSGGTILASQQFAATNVGGHIELDTPAAADAFIINGSSNIASIDVILAPFQTQQEPGENAAIFEVEMNGVVVQTIGQIWTVSCGPQTYNEIGAPNACSASP